VDPKELRRQRLLLVYLSEGDKSDLVSGILRITNEIADRCADQGNHGALLTGTPTEHKSGRKLLFDLIRDILERYITRNLWSAPA
jgi:hypothetical protein